MPGGVNGPTSNGTSATDADAAADSATTDAVAAPTEVPPPVDVAADPPHETAPAAPAPSRRAGQPAPDRSGAVDASRRRDRRSPRRDPAKPMPQWRARVRMTLRVLRSNRTGRLTLRVVVAIAGALVVAVGLALIPLPGPGWLIVIGGLAIWAVEFVWARHLLMFTRARVRQWTRWVGRQSWPVRIALGLVGLVFVAFVVWLSLKYSFGIDLAAAVWEYITTH